MPEGDTIHRTAATMGRALVDRPLERFEAPRLPRPHPSPGTPVTDVEARGKHLLVRFGDGLVLHTHMQMTGSWHLYRPGQRWQRSRRAARVILTVPGAVAVCFSAPIVELLDEPAVERHPALRRLGPDLCLPGVDLEEVVRRVRRLREPGDRIDEVLLDQRVAAGIGNVYKSEVLHLERTHPATPVGMLDDGAVRDLYARAWRLLRENLVLPRRTTVPDGPHGALFVYGREGRACRRCGGTLVVEQTGDPPRVTYWCETCQPPGPGDQG